MSTLSGMSPEQAYEQGYRDGASSLAADIIFQFGEAESMPEMLNWFRSVTGYLDLEWPAA